MSPIPEFTNVYVTISKEMADSLEKSGQGWRIQGEFGLETRMMFWRKRLIERLRNDHRNHNAELLPTLAKSNLFFPILITVLCFAVVLLCKNCNLKTMPLLLIDDVYFIAILVESTHLEKKFAR